MRVLFFGTPEFAVPSLEILSAHHAVLAAVTQPDQPSGRGRQPHASAIKLFARSHGMPIFEPGDPSEPYFLQTVSQLRPELAAVAAYGRLLPKALLQRFPHGAINLHASLLPRYRGAAPISWAIIRGERKTGVTIFQIDEMLDHGPVLLQKEHPIRPEDTSLTLMDSLSHLGAQLLSEAVKLIEKGQAQPQPQEETQVTFAPSLKKEDGIIDWKLDCQEIHNRVRGLQPWPGATTWILQITKANSPDPPRQLPEGQLLKLFGTHPEFGRYGALSTPGTIVVADPTQGLWVQTGRGQLRLDRLQKEGGKPLDAGAFLRGNPIPSGTLLGSLVE